MAFHCSLTLHYLPLLVTFVHALTELFAYTSKALFLLYFIDNSDEVMARTWGKSNDSRHGWWWVVNSWWCDVLTRCSKLLFKKQIELNGNRIFPPFAIFYSIKYLWTFLPVVDGFISTSQYSYYSLLRRINVNATTFQATRLLCDMEVDDDQDQDEEQEQKCICNVRGVWLVLSWWCSGKVNSFLVCVREIITFLYRSRQQTQQLVMIVLIPLTTYFMSS